MAVGLSPPPTTLPAMSGIRLATCRAGLYTTARTDMALFELGEAAHCAAMFTRNRCPAAPVLLAKQHLASGFAPRFLLINAGNANAGNGAAGLSDAHALCQSLAKAGGCRTEQVLPFSTGVIGSRLPMEKMQHALHPLLQALAPGQWLDVARAIMTTDTVPKLRFRQCTLDGETISLIGVSKGSGMIRPDMATMLAFIVTDLDIPKTLAENLLQDAVRDSFHRITVDGDTSTNDACVFIASGTRKYPRIDQAGDASIQAFATELRALCVELAQSIIRDGEGASKFVTLEVINGADEAQCRDIAFAIAHSPLCKVALAASDPNWGRFLAAIGRGHEHTGRELGRVDLFINGVVVICDGARAPGYSEQAGVEAMQQDEIHILIDLHQAQAATRIWTCDLTHEYLRINAEYRS